MGDRCRHGQAKYSGCVRCAVATGATCAAVDRGIWGAELWCAVAFAGLAERVATQAWIIAEDVGSVIEECREAAAHFACVAPWWIEEE